MRLERHVGGLGHARGRQYLEARGWRRAENKWTSARYPEPVAMARAIHLQLTQDLTDGLRPCGWTVVGYSPRGYAQLQDENGERCSLPSALRRQARREGKKVRELTYSLFLASMM